MPSRKRPSVAPKKNPSRLARHLRALSLGLGVVVVLAISASAGYSLTLRGKVYPGVRFGQFDLGGLSYHQAEQEVTRILASYASQPIAFHHGTTQTTRRLSELGLGFDVEAATTSVREAGHGLGWFDVLVSPVYAIGSATKLEPVLIVQSTQLDESLAALASTLDNPAELPRLSYQGGSLSMTRGQSGERLDHEALRAELLHQVSRLSSEPISLSFVSEETLSDAATRAKILQQAEQRLTDSVTLRADEETFSISPEELVAWLTVTKEGEAWKLVLDPKRVRADLVERLSSLERKPVALQTYAASEKVDPVVAGEDGRSLDLDVMLERLSRLWLGSGQTEIEIALKVLERPIEFLTVTAPRANGKSILVDLTRQTAFAFQDGKLQFFTLASTGKYPMPTPTGEFKIYNKTRRQVMDGPGYYLPNVQWVMFYDGDYSLHGTYWHNNFGHPMSHGCTNLSNESAERFYNFGEVGTPVAIIGETPRK